MLVLEDPGGEPLDQLLGEPMEVGRFLRLAIGIAAVLGQVHQRGLVHAVSSTRTSRPAHILVNRATEEVRLTGFGIASRLPRERQAAEPLEFIAGTLAYMAPEQTGRINRSIDARNCGPLSITSTARPSSSACPCATCTKRARSNSEAYRGNCRPPIWRLT